MASYTPTKAMKDEAQRGLDWRREYGRGGTAVGVARARDIINGKDLSLDTVKRMSSYFARHEVDKQAEGFKPGEDGYPSAGRIAWALWGGDAGREWSLAILSEQDDRTNPLETPMSDPEVEPTYSRLDIDSRRVNGRDVEFRAVTVSNIDVNYEEADANTDFPSRFRGYAAVFDSPSEPLPFIETIRPGAFRRSLNSGREVRMFVNHNSDLVLGSTRSGTIEVSEDDFGLLVQGVLPDTSYGRDLSTLMQRGDVASMSFGFSVPKGGDSWSDDGNSRELRELILHEVSVVTGWPAYPATDASVRTDDVVDEPVAPVALPVRRRMNDLYAKASPVPKSQTLG